MRPTPWLLLFALGCGHAPPKGSSGSAVLLVHDDGRPEGSLTFPTMLVDRRNLNGTGFFGSRVVGGVALR